MKKFSKDFIWGGCYKLHINNWRGAFDKDGRGESIWDRFSKLPVRFKRSYGRMLLAIITTVTKKILLY